MGFEAKIIQFLQSGANEGWTAFFQSISLLGSWVGMIFVFCLMLMFHKRYSLTFLITYGLGVGANYILKSIINRDRPYITYEGIQALTDALGNSMPSGHAVSSTIIAVFVCFFVYKLAKTKFTKIATILSMILFVGLVCLSRMYLGVHYLTDLLAGMAVGGIISIIGIAIFRRLELKRVRR